MIISYLFMVATFILLVLSGLQGYYQFQIVEANHSQFALLTICFYLLTETLIMFYFIGAGTAIKKTIQTNGISTNIYDQVKKTKMKLFPHLTLNMALLGMVFILGGAVQTGRVDGWLHSILFVLAFIHFMYTILLQHRGFKENVDIIGKLATAQSTSANDSLA